MKGSKIDIVVHCCEDVSILILSNFDTFQFRYFPISIHFPKEGKKIVLLQEEKVIKSYPTEKKIEQKLKSITQRKT